MIEKKRITLLIIIMVSSCLIVAGVTMAMLYNTSFDQQKARLSEIAQSQARLIEAIARFNASNYHGDTLEATIKQLTDAHSHYKGFGDTGEFTLGKKEGNQVVFLLNHRHYDLDKPKPIPLDSHLGAPIRAALSGRSGTVVGPDYRGEIVLAAHEPVAELNLGIAAKIDLAEIRKPFIKTGFPAGIIMAFVVFAGTLLFIRISDPLLIEIENNRKWLNTTLRSIGDGVIATDDKGVIVFMNPVAEHLTGYEEKQAVGKFLGEVFNIVNEETRKAVESPVDKVLREGIIVGLANHTILISRDGTEHAIDDSGAPIRDDKNKIIGVVMVFRDVTAARKAENDLKESEMRFAAFMENLPACAFIKNSQGQMVFMNKYLQAIFGFEDWVNKTTVELIQSDVAVQMTEDDRRAMATGAIVVQETVTDTHGNHRIFETTKFPIRTLNGKIFLGGIAIDITERKQAEYAWLESGKKYRLMIESIGDVVSHITPDLRYTYISPADEFQRGYMPEEVVGRSIFDFMTPQSAEEIKKRTEPRRKLIGQGVKIEKSVYEIEQICKNGSLIRTEVISNPLYDIEDKLTGFHCVCRDISDRKRAENALRESEERYRTIFEHSPIGIMQYDKNGIISDCNMSFAAIIGTSRERLIGFDMLRSMPDGLARQAIEHALTHGKGYFEGAYKSVSGGKELFIRAIHKAIISDNGQYSGFIGIFEDISDHIHAQEALKESEARYRELFDNINSGVAVYDVIDNGKDFIFRDFNKAGERSDNEKREELIGRSIFEARPGVEKFGLIEVFRKVWKTGEPIRHPIMLYDDERLKGWYENFVYKLPSGEIVAVFEDRTLQKQAEYMLRKYNEKLEAEVRRRTDELRQQQAQLAHAGRLSSLGEMATGIAHELSQPLFIIRLSAETLQLMLRKSGFLTQKYSEEISSIIGSVERASAIINHVRGFARTQHSCLENICLRESVENSLIFFTQQFRHREIKLSKYYEDHLPQVKADIQRFEQVVVNLLSNARYAVDQRKKQESEDYQKKIEIRLLHDVKHQAVVLEIGDNGIGMSADEKERCLDPFFTTKDVGEGTGLGLSIAHGIIREFGGQIEIESEKRVGTTVRVSIPLA